MITFIICVKHYENCHSYDTTWELLKNTLASVCNQTDEKFDVIVVSNKTLDDFADNPKIKNVKFIEVGWKPPAVSDDWQINTQTTKESGMDQIRIDRGTKYILASATAARNKKENHYVMFVDADDFIHKDLAKYINTSNKDVLKIKKGFKLGANGTYHKLPAFETVCGTANITRLTLLLEELNLSNINTKSSQEDIIKTTNQHYLTMIIGSHRWSYDYFIDKGCTGEEVPFWGAVYNCTHDEQHSGQETERFRKKVTHDMITMFNIKTLNEQ